MDGGSRVVQSDGDAGAMRMAEGDGATEKGNGNTAASRGVDSLEREGVSTGVCVWDVGSEKRRDDNQIIKTSA